MRMKRFEIEITGNRPMLMNRMSDDALMGLLAPKTKRKKESPEEKTPRQIADEHAYSKGGVYQVPTKYFFRSLIGVASDYKQSNSARKSFKSIIGGVFQPESDFADILDHNNKPVTQFEVDIARGNNFQAGAVALVRPRFDQWRTRFTAQVDTDLLSEETLLTMLNDAGTRVGVGSYRICNGGTYGKYQVTRMKKLKD